MTAILGIDIGGTGIKGAPVDVGSGQLLSERLRILTPSPATPKAVSGVVVEIARHFAWKGDVGIGFPAAVKRGITLTATHVDPAWVNADASRAFRLALRAPTTVVNDADAAGLAEMRFGAGRGEAGTVLMLTLGTGVGCAFFYRGMLFPNSEFAHLKIGNKEADGRISELARERRKISWKRWAKDINEYLAYMEQLMLPDLIIIGGGVIKDADHFMDRLRANARIVPASLGNNAGIVGAALNAADARQRHRGHARLLTKASPGVQSRTALTRAR